MAMGPTPFLNKWATGPSRPDGNLRPPASSCHPRPRPRAATPVTRTRSPIQKPCSSAEPLLVELLELRVGAPEVAARRRDVTVAGESLRGRHAHLRGPGGDRGVPEPVRGHALGEAGALRRVGHDRLRHPHAHAIRAALLPAPR